MLPVWWNDILESTSPIAVVNSGCIKTGYIPQIYTLSGIVAQGEPTKASSLNHLESSAQHVDSSLLAFIGFPAINTILSNAVCYLFDRWPEVVLKYPTSVIFLLQFPQTGPIVGSVGPYNAS